MLNNVFKIINARILDSESVAPPRRRFVSNMSRDIGQLPVAPRIRMKVE